MIIEKIKEFFETEPDFKSRIFKEIKDTDSLIDSGIIDSLGTLKLVTFIEETFSIEIEMEDLNEKNFATLKDLAEFINHKLNKD
jgi:acyl carrier protein